MLVLLIIFMVSAPLLTVGVPIDLPQSQAKSLEQDKEPLTISVNDKGVIYLQNSEIAVDDLLRQAAGDRRGARRHRGAHLCARRQERQLRYDDEGHGAAVGGRLPSGSIGHRIRAGLETVRMRTASAISTGLHAAVLLWAVVSFTGETVQGDAGGIAAGRHHQRQGILRADQGHQGRAQAGRQAQAAGREERRAEAEDRGLQGADHREAGRSSRRCRSRAAARAQPKPDPIADKIKKTRKAGDQGRDRCRRRSRRCPSSRSSTPTRSPRCSTSARRSAQAAHRRRAQDRAHARHRARQRLAALAIRARRAARAG